MWGVFSDPDGRRLECCHVRRNHGSRRTQHAWNLSQPVLHHPLCLWELYPHQVHVHVLVCVCVYAWMSHSGCNPDSAGSQSFFWMSFWPLLSIIWQKPSLWLWLRRKRQRKKIVRRLSGNFFKKGFLKECDVIFTHCFREEKDHELKIRDSQISI